jgi:hypothetical protein
MDKIIGFIKGGLGLVTGFLKSAAGGIFKWLLLTTAALGVGAKIGSWIDKNFLKPLRDIEKAHYDLLSKVALEKSTERQHKLAKQAVAGDKKSYKSLEFERTLWQDKPEFREMREKSLGIGRRTIVSINRAQSEYMGDNITSYLPYSENQLRKMREEWLAKGKKPPPINRESMLNEVYLKQYGRDREASFLTYLQKHGVKDEESLKITDVGPLTKQDWTPHEERKLQEKHATIQAKAKIEKKKALKDKQNEKVELKKETLTDLSEHERRKLGIIEKEGAIVRANTATISIQSATIKDKEAKLQAQKTNKEAQELKKEVKKVGDKVSKSGTEIQQTQIVSTTNMATSINDSSAVTTGGGGGPGVHGLDPWQQYAILGGMH